MADLDMDDAGAPLDLSVAPLDVLTKILQNMCDKDRFTCALVCKAWAKAAAAATHNVKVWRLSLQKSRSLQQWLLEHGNQIVVLQLHDCGGIALSALPCVQVQDLVLQGASIKNMVWADIAAATKLTSVELLNVQTASQQADVVSALTALPDLQHLTWGDVQCSDQQQPGCLGLQALRALTRLRLSYDVSDVPDSVCQLTALQELCVENATPTALNKLQALTGLTQLQVHQLRGLSLDSPPPQLTGLQHLELKDWVGLGRMPVSFLASCTQLQVLRLWGLNLRGPGSLVASTKLQRLVIDLCGLNAADGVAAGSVSWQQVLPGPRRLPHLTSLQLSQVHPDLQPVDVEHLGACCSSLQALHLDDVDDEQCGTLAQLTGLQELSVQRPSKVSAAGLRQLAALKQLTSLRFVDSWPNKDSRVLQQQMSDKLPGYSHAIVNQAPDGHPPDVTAQLLRMCDLADAAGDS